MNNSFTAQEQAYQQQSFTVSQNVQRTNRNEFQEAVSRYELRKSSRSRLQQDVQQNTVITSQKFGMVENERKSAINDLENSRMSQRIAEKYSVNMQSSQYDTNKQSVQEVMDKYRRGRSTQQVVIESKYVPPPQIVEREVIVDARDSEQEPLNYQAFQNKQQVYEVDYQQIQEDCKDYDGYKKPQREDDVQVELLDSDYVSCKIF